MAENNDSLLLSNMFNGFDSIRTAQNNNSNDILATDTSLVNINNNKFRRLPSNEEGGYRQWYGKNAGGLVRTIEGLTALGGLASIGVALASPQNAIWAVPLSNGLGYASAGAGIIDTWSLPGLNLSERLGRTAVDAIGFVPAIGNIGRVSAWASKYPRVKSGVSFMLPKTPTTKGEFLWEAVKRPTTSFTLQYEIPGAIELMSENGASSSNIMSRGFENFGRDWHDAFAGTTEEQSIAGASNLVNFGTSMFMGRSKTVNTPKVKKGKKGTGSNKSNKSNKNKGNAVTGLITAGLTTAAATANASPTKQNSTKRQGIPFDSLEDFYNAKFKKNRDGSVVVYADDGNAYNLTVLGEGDNTKYIISDPYGTNSQKWTYSKDAFKKIKRYLHPTINPNYISYQGDWDKLPNPYNNFGMKPKNLNGGKLNSLKSLRV